MMVPYSVFVYQIGVGINFCQTGRMGEDMFESENLLFLDLALIVTSGGYRSWLDHPDV
ncbi:MAG: hypothetical protein IPP49_20085 [Saprospiraceae bacterium]|nr:hypothetical protein [Saprospiraceae bacterium]